MRATRLLFRIHTDICGPFPIGWEGKKYFSLFVDDHSRYVGTAFLKHKSEVALKFAEWLDAAESALSLKAAVLQVNNTPEYIARNFRALCAARGITYECTVPDAS